jgi:hypothetical protein
LDVAVVDLPVRRLVDLLVRPLVLAPLALRTMTLLQFLTVKLVVWFSIESSPRRFVSV